MLLQESRRAARTSPAGDLILLEQQDRALWDRAQIAEGIGLVEKSLTSHRFGSYTLQAAIAAVHAEADSAATTDWRQIVMLYNRLAQIQPSPVVELNRAVAIAMCEGPEVGLTLRPDRGIAGTWRNGDLSPGPFRPGGFVPQIRQNDGSPFFLPESSDVSAAGAGTAVP